MSDALFAAGAPGVVADRSADLDCDVAIVGSGMGGAALAWALRDCGARVLVIERGDFLPRERENWSPHHVHRLSRYRNADAWIDADSGRSFVPGGYHYVGGSTKLYGAALPRLREADFGALEHRDGVSPAWPISYDAIEPFYAQAEQRFGVHGAPGDPTEPRRSSPFPFPAVPHEPAIQRLAHGLARQGLTPAALPLGVDWRAGGDCVRCGTCDGYPCLLDAKADADVAAMRPALRSPTVKLLTRATVLRVRTDASGARVKQLDVRVDGRTLRVRAARYVLAAGAVDTAALLLRSRTELLPDGVANRSGAVGRHYMAHVCSFLVGVRPGHDLQLTFEKTLAVNDWYLAGPTTPFPLGTVQSLGKLYGATIKSVRRRTPLGALDWIARRSIDLFVSTEDLPRPENRVQLDGGDRIRLRWRPTGQASHAELVRRMAGALRRCGYPFVVARRLGIEATAHQCGTARMGEDPATSVVDPGCRAHDVRNLWVVDASVFPSSAAVNPALTVAANALRVAATGGIAA